MMQRMRALVLYQPYATLMAIGVKVNETRPRPLAFDGDIAICSGKKRMKDLSAVWKPLLWLWQYRDKVDFNGSSIYQLYDSLPFGKVVCVVEKAGCASTGFGETFSFPLKELDCGNYSAGRFYYPTKNLRRLKNPVEVIGSQGVFFLPKDVESKVRAEIK